MLLFSESSGLWGSTRVGYVVRFRADACGFESRKT